VNLDYEKQGSRPGLCGNGRCAATVRRDPVSTAKSVVFLRLPALRLQSASPKHAVRQPTRAGNADAAVSPIPTHDA